MPGSYESVESPLRVGAIGNGSGSEPCAWYGFHHSDARNLVGDDGGRGVLALSFASNTNWAQASTERAAHLLQERH